MGYYRFFQIFKFFFYGLTSRRNRKLLKILLVCLAIFIGIFWLSQNCAFASTMNNEDVTQSIKYKYDSICLDFLRRYEKSDSTLYKDSIREYITNENNANRVSYYIYYGDDKSGVNCLDNGTFNDSALNIIFYSAYTGGYTISFSNYSNYFGVTSNHILSVQFNANLTGYSLYTTGGISTFGSNTLYIPSELLHYNSQIIYDYFYGNKTLEQIEQQLEQANATLSDINDSLTDDSFDDTQDNPIEMEIFEDYNEDYQDNLFNNVLERFKTNIPNSTSSIYAIHIPIPHSNGQEITLYSNAISKHINYFENSGLYNLIQVCWYVVFFKYFFWFGKKVLDWILTGELLEKGGGAFIKSLEKENAVVNAAMM